MSDKFILNVPARQPLKKASGTIRVDNVALLELERLQRLTGLSMTFIATKAILYALERIELKGEV